MELIDSVKKSVEMSKHSLANPMTVSSFLNQSNIIDTFKLSSATFLNDYETLYWPAAQALGLNHPALDYLDDFLYFDINGLQSSIGTKILDKFGSKIEAANEVIEIGTSMALAGSSITQALSCMNIDLPEIPEALMNLWNMVEEFTDIAKNFIGDLFSKAMTFVNYVISSAIDMYDKVKKIFKTLADMGKKLIDYITSSELFQSIVGLFKQGFELIQKGISALVSALSCAPDILNAVGNTAKFMSHFDPGILQGIQSVSTEKMKILDSLDGDLDEKLVEEVLNSKIGEIYSMSKKTLLAENGAIGALEQAMIQKTNLIDNIKASFSSINFTGN